MDLNADGRPDLVVKAEEACLWGANVGPYWVFRNQPQGYELALQAHALCLEVLPARARGYRHLRTAAATAVSQITVAYTWDGRRYRAGKRQVKALR